MDASVLQTIKRRVNPNFKRKGLSRRGLVYLWWRYIGNAKRTVRAWCSPYLYPEVPEIAQEIIERGIIVGNSDRFLSIDGLSALTEAADLVLSISGEIDVQTTLARGTSDYGKDYLIPLIHWEYEHSPDSPLIRLALDRKLLEIVSSYLGLWPRLHAVGAWLNFPTWAEAKQAQLWHRDPEDIKQLKVFIYLRDVDENCGPFCYIPKTHPFSLGAAKTVRHKHPIRITDDEMAVVFPRAQWLTCTGPANTMIVADTVGYHRGGKATKGNRILITFTYTSGTPLKKSVLRIAGMPSWPIATIQSHALPAERQQ